MQRAIVIGRAIATVKHETLRGHKLLLVQPQLADGRADGPPRLVVDTLGAGIGQTLLVTTDGREARELLGSTKTPVRWTTLGIQDE